MSDFPHTHYQMERSERRRRYLTKRQVSERYQVTIRTVDRWSRSGVLPAPMNINGRFFFDEEQLETRERERMAASA